MGVEATAGTAVRLRVIKLRLSTGQIETLVTTLTEEEMPEEAFDELYALRWGIEVHYGQEKYALEIENFLEDRVTTILHKPPIRSYLYYARVIVFVFGGTP